MKLKTYKNLWGTTGSRDAVVAAVLEAGYDGIEGALFSNEEHAALRRVLKRTKIPFKGVILTRDAPPTVAGQLRFVTTELQELLRTGAESINVIGGYDCWSEDDVARYFEGALKAGEKAGVCVSHETHRNSALYHPVAARRILGRSSS
jgi:sugar phosphate isomerase/epimerase